MVHLFWRWGSSCSVSRTDGLYTQKFMVQSALGNEGYDQSRWSSDAPGQQVKEGIALTRAVKWHGGEEKWYSNIEQCKNTHISKIEDDNLYAYAG